MKELVKCVIPSYKRAENVSTLNVVEHCALVVRENEEKAYRKHNPDVEIIVIPDGEIKNGIADTREWIMRHVNRGNVFMLDDDISSFRKAMLPPSYSKMAMREDIDMTTTLSPTAVYDIIQVDAQLCKELGLYLFGFSPLHNIRDSAPQRPYKLNAIFSGGAFGVLRGEPGCKISLPYHEPGVALCEDYYIALINAYYHRCSLIDFRYNEHSTTYRNTGGLSQYRTDDGEKQAFMYLRKKFGKAIARKKSSPTNNGGTVRYASPWGRSLNIPL
jgi:hypothetical protein|nr:MAG TPA: hypothetical protein [Caudoviricetes sp.]